MLAAATIAAGYLVTSARSAWSSLPGMLSSVMSEYVDGKLDVGKVDVSATGIVFRRVSLSDRDGSKKIIDAQAVRVGFRLADLLRNRKDPASAIDSVEIVRPHVSLERAPDGRWNIADLLRPSATGPRTQFKGRVIVTSGTLAFLDRKTEGKAMANRFEKVNAVIDLNGNRADCRLTARGDGVRAGRISVEARYDLEKRSYSADIDALDADASYWTKYPFNLKFLTVSSGGGDVRMRLSSAGPGRPIRYSGEFLVSDAAVQLSMMRRPARQVEGLVGLKNDEVTLALRARMESTPLEISGRVTGFKGSRLALNLKSDRANLREISGLFPIDVPKGTVLPTSGRVHVTINGPSAKPSALFSIQAPTLSYNQFSGRGLSVDGSYSAQKIVIRNASVQVYGGLLRAQGEFRWGAGGALSLHGSASGLRLSQLPQFEGQQIDSVTSGHFGIESGASGVRGAYRGTLTDGAVGGHVFRRGAVAVSYDGGVHIDEVSADVLGGRVAASGDVTTEGGFDLEVSGAGINLAAVQERYWAYPSVGRVQFRGRLQGTPDAPSFDGQVEAYRIMINGISAERISADLEARRSIVRLRSLEIEDPIGRLTASGDIVDPLSADPRLDLAVSVGALAVEPLAISTGLPFHLAGSLSGDVRITNTLESPEVEGSVRMVTGQVADLPIDHAETAISYRDSMFTLTGFEARSGTGVLRAGGSIGLDDQGVSIAFSAGDLPLDSVARSLRQNVLLSGGLNAEGEMTGTLDDTVVRVTLDSTSPRINGQTFDGFRADLTWDDDVLQVGSASLTDGGAEYVISRLSYSPTDEMVEVGVEVRHAPIDRLVTMIEKGPRSGTTARLRGHLASVPRPCQGVLDADVKGTIDLAGGEPAPNLRIEGTVNGARIGSSDISTIRIEGDWQAGKVILSKLEALSGDTDLLASAVLGPGGTLDVQADVHGLDLETAGKWLKLDQNFSGVADVTIIAEGTTKAPSVEASLDIQNPVIEGMRFDSLRARFSAAPFGEDASAGNRINIDDLTVVLGDSQLSASGFMPVDWEKPSVPRDQPILVEMLLNDDSLKLMSVLAGEAITGQAGGKFSGKISYGGTIDKPDMHGGLTWRDGRLHLARLGKPFEQIEADITLSGSVLTVDRLIGRSAQGGSFRIAGPVDFTKSSLDLSLVTSTLRVSGNNISGKYGETGEVVLDSDVHVAGNWRAPLISGRVSVPKGSVGLTDTDDLASAAVKPAVDPRFDLQVSVGRGLVFRSARLEAALPGSLALGGSLSQPMVDGLLDLADGTIVFPMRSFKILPGSDMRVRVSPGQPALAIVDLQARARIVDVSSLGKRARYTVTMQASGPLDKLRPTFTSSPVGLSEQRIMALVTGQYQFEQILKGSQGADIGRELSGLFSAAVMPSVFDPIEEAFQSALGIDEFALEMGYREPVQVSIGEALGRDVYLSYSAALGARPDYADSRYELKLSYRVRNNLEFSVQTDENRTLGIGAEGKIRF